MDGIVWNMKTSSFTMEMTRYLHIHTDLSNNSQTQLHWMIFSAIKSKRKGSDFPIELHYEVYINRIAFWPQNISKTNTKSTF